MKETGIELEARILAVIRRKRNYFKYQSLLHKSFFQTEKTRQIYSFISDFFLTSKEKRITIHDLKVLTFQKIKDEEMKKECIELLSEMKEYRTKDNEVIDEAIKDFSKRQYAKKAILAGLEALDQDKLDFSSVQENLEKAILISSGTEKDCYHYFDDLDERIKREENEGRISTGIEKLDEALGGGTGPGDLLVFIAPPERGKTLSLVNLAVAALYRGLKVCYITLELSERKIARRFDLRISGRPLDILAQDPARIKNPLAALRRNNCDLVIKDYSSIDPKVEDIHGFILNYQNKMRHTFDLIIVDYADLISPTRIYKNDRFGIKEVYTNLRRMAIEFKVPLITASQANRKSVNKMVVTMEDFAEDFSKACIADVVIGICQTPEELESELCRLYVAKNRSTGRHPIFRVTMKPTTMYLGSIKELNKEKRKTIADRI